MYVGNIQQPREIFSAFFSSLYAVARIFVFFMLLVFLASLLTACQFGDDSRPLVVSGDFPLVYIKQPQDTLRNKVDANTTNIGSDLFMRDISSPDSVEYNLTGILTKGKGTVSSPEVSFDGKKIVFSMRCEVGSSEYCNGDETWNIWTYEVETGEFQRVIRDFEIANLADDIDPVFLPDNRIVFSSTRQQTTRAKYGYVYTDDETRKDASVLHVMEADGSKIEQISFNRSSDFSPSVLQNGKIMFSRREKVGEHLQLSIFTANPDGSDMNVLYGAHSPGEAFAQPRELQNGKVISTVIPFEGTWGGGALLEIDSVNFSDAESPGPAVAGKGVSGQKSATVQEIPLDKTVSKLGRFTTPYPLLDNSDQVLVSFSFYQTREDSVSNFTSIALLDEQEAPPHYGIYMLNMNDKSMKPLILPESGFALTDAAAVFPRSNTQNYKPNRGKAGVFDGTEPEGIINIKSVYDTDQFGRMGQGVLTPFEISQTPIPLIDPEDPFQDARLYVADIASIKNPLITQAHQRPARFIRVAASVPVPLELSPEVLGETDFEMQKILGYAPIEPDGSVQVKVPADTPLIISVLDSKGRAFEKHNNRIQVRPGETLTCNGCHSPLRNPPLNRSPIAGNHENTSLKFSNGQITGATALENETMAETRTRVDAQALQLDADIVYRDVWTDASIGQVSDSFTYPYPQISAVPTNGEIHYPTHIQPLWDLPRPSGACSSCHNSSVPDESLDPGVPSKNPTGLNLRGFSGSGIRMLAYNSLLVGQLLFDEDGNLLQETIGGRLSVRRSLPLVNAGFSRGSYLVEKLFGEELFAEKILPADGLDHSGFMSDAEKRLIVEWIDVGAQYFNTAEDENGELRKLESAFKFVDFANYLNSPLINKCARCHALNTIGDQINLGYVDTNFVLDRNSPENNFDAASYMVNTIDNPRESYLLARPSGLLDTFHNEPNGNPVLPVTDDLFLNIEKWILGIL